MAEQIERYPLHGVETWINPKNKFLCFQIHYTADPEKREGYIEGIRGSMPIQQFMQEFELQWDSFQGQPVYPDWNERNHGTKEDIAPVVGLPLLLGVDQGLTPACVIAQMEGETLRVLKEITAVNMGAERFSEIVKKVILTEYPAWGDLKNKVKVFMDPAAWSRKDTDESKYCQIWAKRGFAPMPGAMTWEERRQSVENFLIKMRKSGPCLSVSLPNCPMLTRGFNGGYRYPEKAFEIEQSKIRPLKDEHSHVHDAFQYLCTGINRVLKPKMASIPAPSYAFGMTKDKFGVSHG